MSTIKTVDFKDAEAYISYLFEKERDEDVGDVILDIRAQGRVSMHDMNRLGATSKKYAEASGKEAFFECISAEVFCLRFLDPRNSAIPES